MNTSFLINYTDILSKNNKISFTFRNMKKFIFLTMMMIAFSLSNAQSVITIGSGSNHTSSSYPFSRYFKYSGCELLYTGAEIGTTGDITSIAFDKYSGTSGIAINNISIYMKTTSSSVLTTPTCTTGYILVYSGSFPNNGTGGWQTQILTTAFTYSNTSENLSILIVHGSQAAVNTTDRPVYNSSSTSTDQCSYYVDDSNGWSCSKSMNMPGERPNIQLTFSSVTTNILELKINHLDMTIYPNPASQSVKFNITGDQNRIQKIILVDAQGKIDFETTNIQQISQNGISVNTLPAGIYKLIIQADNQILSKTIIIE